MLKKLVVMASLLLIAGVSMQAQEVKKPRLLIDFFMEGDNVKEENSDKVRHAVMDAVNKSKRFEVVDIVATFAVAREAQRRSGEEAMSDEKARTEIISNGAYDYILKGEVTACSIKEETKDGKKSYQCVLNYSVTVTEVATTTTVATKAFDHSPSGLGGTLGKFLDNSSSADGAVSSAVNMIESDITDFLIEEFPLTGEVIPMDYEVKKDKVTALYIALGSDHGVKEGDFFAVSVPKTRAGRTTYSEVGRVKVTEVVDGTMAFCKVTKGDKQLLVELQALAELSEEEQQKNPLKVKGIKAPSLLGL